MNKENAIKWGPFRLRIPFIHMKFLTGEFLQGLIIAGATALAGAPIVMALGLSFEQAVACALIASILITSGPIIFGEPLAPGWVTPALPLVIVFFISKGFFDGNYREEAFQYMAAMCIEFTLIIIFLGVTGLGKVIVEKIPNALKSGIILGAALAAFYQIFFSEYERYIGDTPVAMFTILIICTITTFSEPFKRLAENNKILRIIGSLGLLPGFMIATLIGYFIGEISFDIQSGFIAPPVNEVYKLTSPFSIGFPPMAYYLEVLPLVIIGYLLLFGDFVTGIEILKDGQKKRPDEPINIDINRAHNSVGIRNLLGSIVNPFFPTQGALWTGVHVVIVERWKQGNDVMKSLFDGIGSYYLMGIPLLFFALPFITFMKPLMILALGVTLVLTGLACSYVAMSLVKRNSEIAISIVTALFVAFGEFNGVAAPWIGILIGLVMSLLLVDKIYKRIKLNNFALEISDLRKVYSGGTEALKGISLKVQEGDFYALLGPNGAGKSSTIGIIGTLVTKTGGSVKIFNKDIDSNVSAAKSILGVVSQEINFSQFEKVIDIVTTQAGFYGITKSIAKPKVESMLKRLGLWDKRNDQARTLSGGYKRRLMIAKALIHEPKLLILDEPTAGVDIELRREMWDFLKEINKNGTTIILTTHYLEEAEQLCRNIGIIDQGEIVVDTSMKDLLSRLDVQGFVLDLEEPLEKEPAIEGFELKLDDSLTLVTAINKDKSINSLFSELNKLGIKVKSMRNESNRLEELFIEMIKNKMNKQRNIQVAVTLWTLTSKEIRRFMRIWIQTLVPPAVTMSLYFVIFGSLIGPRIGDMDGFDYVQFMIPGLIMMSVITNSYANVVSSFYGVKFQKSIEELLISPMPNWTILLGFILGGVSRGILVGIIVFFVSLYFYPEFEIVNPGLTILVLFLTATLFSLMGFINAVFADSFDDISVIPTFVLTPLIYLGGVFYSINILPEFWRSVSMANPMLYVVNTFREGMLGISDVSIPFSLSMISLFILFLQAFLYICFIKGLVLENENKISR